MKMYNLLCDPVDDEEVSRGSVMSHVGMDFFLNHDVTAVKEHTYALNVLL